MRRKKKKPELPVVWVIDDEAYNRTAFAEDLKDVATVRSFESAFDASESSAPSPEIVVIDLSAVSPVSQGAHMAYSGIASLGNLYPGAEIVIASGVGIGYAEEVVDRVREVADNVISVIPWRGSFFKDVGTAIKKKLKAQRAGVHKRTER